MMQDTTQNKHRCLKCVVCSSLDEEQFIPLINFKVAFRRNEIKSIGYPIIRQDWGKWLKELYVSTPGLFAMVASGYKSSGGLTGWAGGLGGGGAVGLGAEAVGTGGAARNVCSDVGASWK